jgi:hypothetical protein
MTLSTVEDTGTCCAVMADFGHDVAVLEVGLSCLRSLSAHPGAPVRMLGCVDTVLSAMQGHKEEERLQVAWGWCGPCGRGGG